MKQLVVATLLLMFLTTGPAVTRSESVSQSIEKCLDQLHQNGELGALFTGFILNREANFGKWQTDYLLFRHRGQQDWGGSQISLLFNDVTTLRPADYFDDPAHEFDSRYSVGDVVVFSECEVSNISITLDGIGKLIGPVSFSGTFNPATMRAAVAKDGVDGVLSGTLTAQGRSEWTTWSYWIGD